MADVKIAPSILSADFGRLAEEVRIVRRAGADEIHVDVMDGRFVPNLTLGPPVVRALVGPAEGIPLDVHLMIVEPDRYLDAFAAAGASILTVHQETCVHLHRTLTRIRELGARAGVSVNLATLIALLEPVVGEIDRILIMTVNPGFGGQTFIEACLPKIEAARRLLERHGRPGADLEVDGGVDPSTAPRVVAAGADVLVAGAAVFGAGPDGRIDPPARLAALRAAVAGIPPRAPKGAV
jgi:ribulose-phosphate 3-epimerase